LTPEGRHLTFWGNMSGLHLLDSPPNFVAPGLVDTENVSLCHSIH